MARRSRLNKKPKNGFVKRLKRKFPAISATEIGLGVGGSAVGLAIPPTGVVLIPAGAYLTASGIRDLKRELGAKDIHLHFPEGGVLHAKKKEK